MICRYGKMVRPSDAIEWKMHKKINTEKESVKEHEIEAEQHYSGSLKDS